MTANKTARHCYFCDRNSRRETEVDGSGLGFTGKAGKLMKKELGVSPPIIGGLTPGVTTSPETVSAII